MYVPKYFRVQDWKEIESFIHKNSFALLITRHQDKPWATHLPIELDKNTAGEFVLRGHVSRGNSQWKAFEKNETALAVFQGSHSYVSSSWYKHVNVPTWNYIAIHVTGKLKMLTSDELYDSLKKLVDKYEVISKNPVTVDGIKEHVLKEMKGIAGFEMSIDHVDAKWKMSQNRKDEDYSNIIAELEKLNDFNSRQVAQEMKRMRK